MKTKTTKLSLEDFKLKAKLKSHEPSLDKISGGILGACHCESYYGQCSVFTYCPPNK